MPSPQNNDQGKTDARSKIRERILARARELQREKILSRAKEIKAEKEKPEEQKPAYLPPGTPSYQFGIPRTSILNGEPYIEPVPIEKVRQAQGFGSPQEIRQTPERGEKLLSDLGNITGEVGKAGSESLGALISGNPLESVAEFGKGLLLAPGAIFGGLDRLAREVPGGAEAVRFAEKIKNAPLAPGPAGIAQAVFQMLGNAPAGVKQLVRGIPSGEDVANVVAKPFELAGQAVTGLTNLIASSGVDQFVEETLRAAGVQEKDINRLKEFGITVGEINQILAQYGIGAALFGAPKRFANKIVEMQAEASRPMGVYPGTAEPVPFIPFEGKVGERQFTVPGAKSDLTRTTMGYRVSPEGQGIPGDMPTLPAIPEGGMLPDVARVGQTIRGVREAGLPQQVKGLLPEKSVAPKPPPQEPTRFFRVGPEGEVVQQPKQAPAPIRKTPAMSPTVKDLGTFPEVRASAEEFGLPHSDRIRWEKILGPESKNMTDVQIIDEINRRNLWPSMPLNEMGRRDLYDLVARGWITKDEALRFLALDAEGGFKVKGTTNKTAIEQLREYVKSKKKQGKIKSAKPKSEKYVGKQKDKLKKLQDQLDLMEHDDPKREGLKDDIRETKENIRVAKESEKIIEKRKSQEGVPPSEPDQSKPSEPPKIVEDPTRPEMPEDAVANAPAGDKAIWKDANGEGDGTAVSYLGADDNLENGRAVIIQEPNGKFSIADADGNPFVKDGKKQIYDNIDDAKEIAQVEYAPASKEFELSSRIVVYEVGLPDIKQRTKDFQTRSTAFAKKSVESIKQDFYDGVWRYETMDPILLWEDPVTKDLYTLNHSRRQAFEELYNEGNKEFGTVPSKILRGVSFEEAERIAKRSNKQATPEGVMTRANLYREMRQKGKTIKSIQKEALKLEGRGNYLKIINISHINPNGKLADLLNRIAGGEDILTSDVASLNAMAEWIGDIRRRYPKISDVQENEMFEYLLDNYGGNGIGIRSRGQFHEIIEAAIEKQSGGRTKFKSDQPINIKRGVRKSPAEIEYDKQIKEAEAELANVSREISRLTSKLKKQGLTEPERRRHPEMQKLLAEHSNRIYNLKQLTDKEVDNVGAIRSSEMTLFDEPAPTYSASIREAFQRLKEKGIIDRNIMLGSLGYIPIDPAKVAYIVDPIMKKIIWDAKDLVERGMLKDDQVGVWLKNRADELIASDPEFRNMSGKEKAAIAKALQKEVRDLNYVLLTGEFRTKEREKFDQALMNSMGEAVAVENPTTPRSEESTNPNPRYRDNTRSLTGANLHTAGRYLEKQGLPDENGVTPGAKAFDHVNNVDRESAQEAGKDERLYRISIKKLNNTEFLEFVRIADQGGNSLNPRVQNAVVVWRRIADRIYDAAKEAGLEEIIPVTETLLDGTVKTTFKKVPIRKMDYYFPHDHDVKALNKASVRKSVVEKIADDRKLTLVEAEDLLNEWLKWNYEQKYGHLERPREFDIPGWKQTRDVIPTYIEKAWHRIKMREHMGENYEVIHDLIEQIGREGGDYRSANRFFDRWLGREEFSDPGDRGMLALSKVTGSWQVATKLQLLNLLDWTQLNNAGFITGSWGLVKNFLKTAANYKEAVRKAEGMGAIIENSITMHMKEAMSATGIGGKMMRWTGVNKEEMLLRTFSGNIISAWMADQVPKLSRPRQFGIIQRTLRNLNLERQIDLNAVKERGYFTEQELDDIGYEGARYTQFLTRTQDVQPWISDPRWKVFTQFKAFAAQQSKLMYETILTEARHGNFRPLRHLLIAFPIAGAAASTLRDFVRGRKMKNIFQREDEDWIATILRYYATVGGLSILWDMYQSAQHAPSALGEYFMGPTMSDVTRFFYSASQMLQKKPKTRAMKGWLAREIPVPVIQQIAIEFAKPAKSSRSPFGIPSESMLRGGFGIQSDEGGSNPFGIK